jgi:hypothetical protein
LFGGGQYSAPVYIWTVGYIFGEKVIGKCIFKECPKKEIETIFR